MINRMISILILLIFRSLMAMYLDVPLIVYIYMYLDLFALPEHLHMLLASVIITDFTVKLLKQGYRYHKIPKAFFKFCRRHFEFIEKYHVSLKILMQQGICNPEFYVVSVCCFGVRFSVMFHFMFVHYTFSSVWVAEWPPFGK